jgi:hypothetical protein
MKSVPAHVSALLTGARNSEKDICRGISHWLAFALIRHSRHTSVFMLSGVGALDLAGMWVYA